MVSRPRSVPFSLTNQVQSILVAHFQPAVHFIVFLKLGLRVRLEMIGDVIFHHPLPQPFQLCFFSGADSRRAQPGQAQRLLLCTFFKQKQLDILQMHEFRVLEHQIESSSVPRPDLLGHQSSITVSVMY